MSFPVFLLLFLLVWCGIGALIFTIRLLTSDHSPELFWDDSPIRSDVKKIALLLLAWPLVEGSFEITTETMSSEEFWNQLKKGAEGALPTGTKVEKCNSTESSRYPDGTQGVVKGSYQSEDKLYYIVDWDNVPADEGGIVVESSKLKVI